MLAPMQASAANPDIWQVLPKAITLDGPEATRQITVQQKSPDGLMMDWTHQAKYLVQNPGIARIDETGMVQPVAEGKTMVVVSFQDRRFEIPLEVRGFLNPTPVSFEQQIMPLLTKAGCNSGGCHGKAEGQNGFKLSVFGFDPLADYIALVSESRGRRVMPEAPEKSLLVTKATGQVPHGGGRKLQEGTIPYKALVRWIAEGAQFGTTGFETMDHLEMIPAEQVLGLEGNLQLQAIAVDAKGNRRCVTAEAEFESNMSTIAGVDRKGWVQASSIPGEAAVLARYLGHVTVCRITIPRKGASFQRPKEFNLIDRHVFDKLQKLGISPSELASDSMFLRRVYLDMIGTLPTAAEAKNFLQDTSSTKRSALVDALLKRSEYSDYWAMQWADLLRIDRDVLNVQGSVAMTRWLKKQFQENRPYDAFVRDVLTAHGSVGAESPAGFYKVVTKPDVMARSISQLFLGVRIECAECHHHPSDRWGQEDYYGLAGFFTGVGKKAGSSGEAIIFTSGGDVKQPGAGKVVPTHALGAEHARIGDQEDRRKHLADWMTSPSNPWFSRAIVNRVWAHYFGHGIVDPIDDLRVTNPASNEPLLADLSKFFIESKYDLQALTRLILNSRTYQMSGSNAENRSDSQNFSHSQSRAMPAEVLLDAICQVTGVAEKFNGWPEGARAIQMWDNRMPSYFLKIFGRPVRTSVCECERSNEPSIAQALHLMNSAEISAKIHSRKGTARKLAMTNLSPEAIIDELYLGLLSRFPSADERNIMMDFFKAEGQQRQGAIEDVMWTLLNTKEFVFIR